MRLIYVYGTLGDFQQNLDRAVKEGEARGEEVVGVAHAAGAGYQYSAILSFAPSPQQPEGEPRVISESGALDR